MNHAVHCCMWDGVHVAFGHAEEATRASKPGIHVFFPLEVGTQYNVCTVFFYFMMVEVHSFVSVSCKGCGERRHSVLFFPIRWWSCGVGTDYVLRQVCQFGRWSLRLLP